ncbi:MAG: hypothetical protein AVDCRST_MAG26-3005 [uncultured Chloroflexia bacterium]|uniref:Uncharacterized protein n=1 Tax=uncultured Chloroflexia bacterium TaxID=1672391 RepID=A0A6J4JBT8_9CHLR|nr:MAG: hypothetical protein AVDCRST_MAG26-3005 [uncultured Chloroflexia bacterium]
MERARGIFQDRRIRGVPALIVEILSPSHPDQDLDVKRKAYATACASGSTPTSRLTRGPHTFRLALR